MASCDWQKIKTSQEAKAMLRHCITDERVNANHANVDIDKTRTGLNVAFGLMSDYAESCMRYDERIAELDAVKGANKRKDRVTLIGLSIPTPEGMSDYIARQWFTDVYKHIEERFGSENVLGGTVHFDEMHAYKDAETGERRESRAHLHAYVVPVHDERLNAKQVMSKSNMIALNREVESMTRELYPEYRFMTGTKRKSRKSVEELKNASVEREAEARAQQIVADAQKRAEAVLSNAEHQARLNMGYARKEAQKASEDATEVSETLAEVSALRDAYKTAIAGVQRDDEGLVEYAKQVKYKDGTSIYDRYQKRQQDIAEKRRAEQAERERRERDADDKAREYQQRMKQREGMIDAVLSRIHRTDSSDEYEF